MDSLSGPMSRLDLSRLNDREKQDLTQFVVQEAQKAKIQESIHSTTDMCFNKCVTTKISAAQLSSQEDTCMRNCVERFMDGTRIVYRELEKLKGR